MDKLGDERTFIELIGASNFKSFCLKYLPNTKMTLLAIIAKQRDFFVRNKKGILLSSYTLTFVGFLLLGGIIFKIIEGPQYVQSQKDILAIKGKILEKHPNVSGDVLDDYLNELRKLGIRGLPDAKGHVKEWTFADSVLFSSTLLTTIGYGHMTPQTDLGKVACVLYTGIGIPITLLLLAAYVNRLERLSESFKALLFRKLQTLMNPFHIRFVHIATVLAAILLVCFIFPSIAFTHYEEGWGMLESIYYCFITLTTVGLGDMVPAMDPEMPYIEVYKYCVTIYMIAGLTIMMFMMAISADFHQHYNCAYENLPFTISSENMPILQEKVSTYGSLLTQNEERKNQPIYPIVIQQQFIS